MNIIIFTKDNCPNCVAAKRLLNSKALVYEDIDAASAPRLLENMLRNHPDARQMPQIFINGQRVGGLAGLQAALKQMDLL